MRVKNGMEIYGEWNKEMEREGEKGEKGEEMRVK